MELVERSLVQSWRWTFVTWHRGVKDQRRGKCLELWGWRWLVMLRTRSVDRQDLHLYRSSMTWHYSETWTKSVVSLFHSFVLKPGLWSRSRRLGLETYQHLVSVSSREKLSTSRSRPFTSRAQVQFSAKLCRPQYAVWTGLDVVSLCCSYYCSSY